jgi:AraC-like DNA-binding protein/mannose-6-phosphate isomerase-like protein (cupin superfamily)
MLRPLTPLEQDYKQLYDRYQVAHQSHLTGVQSLLDQLSSYPDYPAAYQRHFGQHPPYENMDESLFVRPQDVEVLLHPRYVPGFMHSQEFFEILCVLTGDCRHVLGQQEYRLSAGDICILAPHTTHGLPTCTEDTIILNIMIRSSTFAQTFFGSLQENTILTSFFTHALYHAHNGQGSLSFSMKSNPELQQILLTMLYEYRTAPRYASQMLNSLLSAFFILLMRSYADSAQNMLCTDAPSRDIVSILEYLQANCSTLSLSDLARHFAYSDRQMSRLLRANTDKTFTELQQQLRLEKACHLLRNTTHPIQEIINSCGYTNPTHFYRLFATHYQQTPADYRKAPSRT